MLSDYETYLNKLLYLQNIKYKNYDPLRDVEHTLSAQRLAEIQDKGDLPKARMLEGNDNRFHLFALDMKK